MSTLPSRAAKRAARAALRASLFGHPVKVTEVREPAPLASTRVEVAEEYVAPQTVTPAEYDEYFVEPKKVVK